MFRTHTHTRTQTTSCPWAGAERAVCRELEAAEHKTAVRSCSVKGAPDTCAVSVSRPGSGGGAAGQTQ